MNETVLVEFARAAGAAFGITAAKKVLEEGSKTLIRIATDSTEKPSMRGMAIIGIAAILISPIIFSNKK